LQHIKKHNAEQKHLWNSDWYYDTSISRFALKFSNINKIVESDNWANLIPENGLDGGSKGSVLSEQHKQKIKIFMTGKCFNDFDEETRKKMSESARKREIEKVNNGTSNFAGKKGSVFASNRNKKLIEQGEHNFLYCGNQVSKRVRKRIEEGTYHALGRLLCVDKDGNKVYIESIRYKEQIGPVEDKEYVHVSSNEAKRRKLTAMKGN
jgi:hypothetical protein